MITAAAIIADLMKLVILYSLVSVFRFDGVTIAKDDYGVFSYSCYCIRVTDVTRCMQSRPRKMIYAQLRLVTR